MIRERKATSLHGIGTLIVLVMAIGFTCWGFASGAGNESIAEIVLFSILLTAELVALGGFFMVNPNEAKVLQLFGRYIGTVRTPGLRFANPFYSKKSVSLRVRNFETSKLKVNDNHGNPIEIAAVVVWKVVDTAEAVFAQHGHQLRLRRARRTRGVVGGRPARGVGSST